MDNSLEKDRLLKNLKALNKVSQIVVESLDTNRMLMGVLKEVFAISGFNMGVISETLDNKLKPVAAIGLSQGFIRELDGRLIKDMLCGHVLRSNKPLAIENDLPGQPISASVAPILIREGLESYVGIPIRLKQIPVAVLCLFDKHPRKLPEDELELLMSICNQLGGSIERKTEDEIIRAREYTENLIETAQDAIVCIDEKGKITIWNKWAEKVFGYSKNEIMGQPIRTIITAKIFEAFLKTAKERIIGRTIEISGKTKEGVVIPIEMSLSSLKITNERYTFTMIIRDATFQREAKRQLIEKKKELEKANSELVALITSQTNFY